MSRRWLKCTALGVVGGIALFSAWVYGSTELRLRKHYDVSTAPLSLATGRDVIARGEHVARALAKCTTCHGEDLGGRVIAENPLVGRLSAPNLTSGPAAHRSQEERLRALVHGVSASGQPLVLMPSHEFAQLSDADLAAVLAYVNSVAPVARQVPALHVGPMYRLLLALHEVKLPAEQIDHTKQRGLSVATDFAGSNSGEYLAKTGGCFGCHGSNLAGGAIAGMPPGTPRAADIRAQALASWSYFDFERALRHGIRPDGRHLADIMPWRAMSSLSDAEVRGLYQFLSGKRGA